MAYEITHPRDASRIIFGHLTGYLGTHVIVLGLELGLFKTLNELGEAGAATLAEALELHAPYVDAWLKAAHALGLLDPAGPGRFKPAPFMDLLLGNDDSMMNVGPLVELFFTQMGMDWPTATELYRTGGVHTFQEKGERFSALVARATQHLGRMAVAEGVPQIPGLEERLRTGGAILDMGCGGGRLVAAHAEAYPQAEVVGVDIDAHGIRQAQEYLQGLGYAPRARAELQHGAEIAHENEFDLVTMVLVLHETEQRHREQIVANCFKALKPGGALLVVDENYPATLDEARNLRHQFAVMGAWVEATMGNVFLSGPEQRDFLERHGFRDVTQTPSQTGLLLTWGLKPA